MLAVIIITACIVTSVRCYEYSPHLRAKIASSVAKGERREQERRAVRREMCHRCKRPPVQCVCASLPRERIQTETDIVILQHPAEFRRKTFSTVPLIPLVLENVKVFVGHNFEPHQIAPFHEAIAKRQRLLLLFPGTEALSLDSPPPSRAVDDGWMPRIVDHESLNTPNTPPRNTLILIDGTWTQARRMVRNSPLLLKSCQRVQFSSTSSSIYDAVRKEPKGNYVSTLEACAQALTLIEPDRSVAQAASKHLHTALHSLVEIQLRHNSKVFPGSEPRFVGRTNKTASLKRQQRRLELEQELFDNDRSRDQNQSHKDLGDGATLRPLNSADASFVNSRWPHRSAKSLAMIEHLLTSDCCFGIKHRDGLCACILRYHNGSLGMLHVDEAFRRRGFATALVSEAARVVQSRGKPLVAFIEDGNCASEALFAKLGWVRADLNARKGTGKRRAKRKWINE